MIDDVFGKKNEEMTKEQADAICYKSKLLNKYFDSYDELKKAEDVYKKANAEKLAKANEKKELAHKIEEAYKAYRQLEQKQREELANSYNAYVELKNSFIEKYGDFHMTYTNKEPKVEVEHKNNELSIEDAVNFWANFLTF